MRPDCKNDPEIPYIVMLTFICLSSSEIEHLQQKPHQLKGQRISVVLAAHPPGVILPPCHQSLPMSTCGSDTALNNVLEVKNIPSNVDEKYLQLYFRSPISGGSQDAVQECTMIGRGTAQVSFHRPEGTVHRSTIDTKANGLRFTVIACFV